MSSISPIPSTTALALDKLSSLPSESIATIGAMLPLPDLINFSNVSKTLNKVLDAINKTQWLNYANEHGVKKEDPKISTLIPIKFSNLSRLTTLELPHSGIQMLPLSLVKLSNLKILNLEGNALISIPSFLIACTAISELNLSHNPLGTWPKVLLTFKNLATLNLSATRLSSLPTVDILKMRKLEVLNLSENNLSGFFPGEIMALPKLKHLDLRGNHFKDQSEQYCIDMKLKTDRDQIDMVSIVPKTGVIAWDLLTCTLSISPWENEMGTQVFV